MTTSEQQKVLIEKIKLKQKINNIEQIENSYEQVCKELQETKKYYAEFRKKVKGLDIDQILTNEKSFCFYGADGEEGGAGGMRKSFDPTESIDKGVLAEMKKYKNCNPEDVSVLKGLRLKISNYLLTSEGKMLFEAQRQSHRLTKTPLHLDNKILEVNIYPKDDFLNSNHR